MMSVLHILGLLCTPVVVILWLMDLPVRARERERVKREYDREQAQYKALKERRGHL